MQAAQSYLGVLAGSYATDYIHIDQHRMHEVNT
jgi:hypothetical protein